MMALSSGTVQAQATEEHLESLIERKINLIAVAAGFSDVPGVLSCRHLSWTHPRCQPLTGFASCWPCKFCGPSVFSRFSTRSWVISIAMVTSRLCLRLKGSKSIFPGAMLEILRLGLSARLRRFARDWREASSRAEAK